MIENSNYLYDDRDSLILQMRPNNRGSYTINSIEFTFDGFTGDVNIDIYFGSLENGIIESDWEYVGTASPDSYTVNTAYDVPRSAVFQIKFVRIGNGDEIEFKQADIDAFAKACEKAGVSQAGQLTKMMREFAESVAEN